MNAKQLVAEHNRVVMKDRDWESRAQSDVRSHADGHGVFSTTSLFLPALTMRLECGGGEERRGAFSLLLPERRVRVEDAHADEVAILLLLISTLAIHAIAESSAVDGVREQRRRSGQ